MALSGFVQTLRANLSAWLVEEFRPEQLLRSLTTGFVIFILEVIVAVSFAALIFSKELLSDLPYGISLILAGDALLCFFIALLSSYPGSIGVEQDAPGAILALSSGAVVATLPLGASQMERLSTVVIMIVATSLLTGVFFILLGVFKLGGFVRFLPYSVIGGFLAGTGWLLTIGGVGVMVEVSPSLDLFRPYLMARWLPGMILGLVMLVAVNRSKSPLALPAAFVAGLAAFYVVAWITHTPFAELSSQGWLLGAFPSGSLWRFPLQAEILAQANWTVIAGQVLNLAPVLIVSTIALLLNANGLELIVKRDVDLNRELVTAGIGNLASGLGGGIVGYHAISLSSLNHALSGGKRLPGLIVAILLGLTLYQNATSLLIYIPKMILGALLVFVGLAMLFDWVYQAWFKFPKSEFLIIMVILLVVAVRGYLEAIALGLVLSVVLFVVNYSRVSVIKQELCGGFYRSRVTRSRSQWEALTRRGDELCVLKLQGFIFFGTANSLFEQVRERTQRTDLPPVRYVILDFAQVTGLDSTAMLSFAKLLQLAQEKRFTLVLSGLSGRASQQFARAGFQDQPDVLMIFGDLDHGIEWCENQILATIPLEAEPEDCLQAQLKAILPGDEGRIERLIHHLERHEFAEGDYLIHQGDEPDRMYFIESGRVTARLEAPGEEPVRLETMGGGRTVGELGFFLGVKRTAAVVADQTSVVYSISKEALAEIEKADPEVANTFHRVIVQLLGERTVHLIRAVDALQR